MQEQQGSLFLFLLFFLGHLDERVLQHRHPGDEAGELLPLGQLLVVVGDALGDPVGADADLVLGEDLLDAHDLLVGVLDHPFLGLPQDLLEGLLLGGTAVGGQRTADDVELGGDGLGGAWLVLPGVDAQLAGDEGVLDELLPGLGTGGGEGGERAGALGVDVERGHVLEVDYVLSLLFGFGGRGLFEADADLVLEDPGGFRPALEFALGPALALRPHGAQLRQFYVLVDLPLVVVAHLADFDHAVLVVLVVVLIRSLGVVVDLDLGPEFVDDFLLLLGLAVCGLLLSLDGDVVDVDLCVLLVFGDCCFLSLLKRLLLLRQLDLLDELLLVDHHCRLDLDYLHVGIVTVLVEDLALIILEAFLGVLIFWMFGPESAIELLLAVLQLAIVDPGVIGIEGRQFLVPNRPFLKIARDWAGGCGPGVGRLRPGLGGGRHGPRLVVESERLQAVIGFIIGDGPLVDFIEVLYLVL